MPSTWSTPGLLPKSGKKGASTSLSSGQGKDGELLEVLLKMKSEEETLIRKVTLEKENLLSFLHLKTS